MVIPTNDIHNIKFARHTEFISNIIKQKINMKQFISFKNWVRLNEQKRKRKKPLDV